MKIITKEKEKKKQRFVFQIHFFFVSNVTTALMEFRKYSAKTFQTNGCIYKIKRKE